MASSDKELFIVVDAEPDEIRLGQVTFAGAAHTIGSWAECAAWQLQQGVRSTTSIIPF